MATNAHAAGAAAAAADAPAASKPATPEQLGAAARRGDVDALVAMLDAGADCNGRGAGDGMTALHEAAAAGQLAAAQLLLERGADVAAALQVAAGSKHFNWQPLHFAAAEGHAPLVELLLARGADAAEAGHGGRTPFLEAAWCGHTGALRAFLDAGVPVDAHRGAAGMNALHLAALTAQVEVVALLLERGADVHAVDGTRGTPLHSCLMITRGAPPRSAKTLQLLLSAGVDVNAPDSSGQSPLHFACRSTNLGAVEALLAAGADVHTRDRDGTTALHSACGLDLLYDEKQQIIPALLAAGADASAADKAGQEPLHHLAACGQYVHGPTHRYEARASEAVAALVAAGADLSAVDSAGNTPLLVALQQDPRNEPVLLALAHHAALYKCRECADAARQRVGLQGLVVGAAAEAARLRREQASWQQERAALETERADWQQQQAALERERTALEREHAALAHERTALEAARAALVVVYDQAAAAGAGGQQAGPAPKRPRHHHRPRC